MAQKTIHILLKNNDKAKELQKYLTKSFKTSHNINFQAIKSFSSSSTPVEACLMDPTCFEKEIPKSLKWAHSTWAGVDGFLHKLEKPLSFTLTRSAIYGRMMSEYVICNILNNERNNYYTYSNQQKKLWAKDGMTHSYSSLRGKKAAVLGSGEIGGEVSRMLKQGFDVTTVAALVKNQRNKNNFVENYYTDLGQLLDNHALEIDLLISVLPSTKQTIALLEPENVFSKLKNCTFINIGRGDVCSEGAILRALENGNFKHCVLDVFPVEPLPEESRLWSHPNVIVTPHVSGKDNTADICQLFMDNLELYLDGKDLKYIVNVDNEY